MKISELVEILEDLREEHGDLDTVCRTLTHAFPPNVGIQQRYVADVKSVQTESVVVLNL